jgi:hypothetical protein
MSETNRQSASPQSPSDIPPELDIDPAFQRLLKIIQDPRSARDRLRGSVPLILRDRAGASEPFRLTPENFSDFYDIILNKEGDDWHASLRLRAGVFGGYSLEDYKATIPAAEFEALCKEAKSTRPAGATRGAKAKYDWPVFQAEFFGRLFYDDIGPHDEINIAQRASDLMTWGQRHLGDEKTPEDTVMRENVTKWWDIWKRKPKTEAQELRAER